MQTKMLVLVAGTLGLATSVYGQVEQRELLADISARTSYQGGGSYNERGFTISDASGDNSLTIGGALQFNLNASFRDSDSVGDQDDFTWGFSTPLTRVRASGTIGSRELSYKIQLTMNGEDGVAAIDDAFAQWDFGNGWAFRWGQFNLPVVREVVVGAEDHLGTDFSPTAAYFGQGYSQGVQFEYRAEQIRFLGAFSDGAGTANTNFTSPLEADYALSARLEGLVVGSDWSRFNDYTSWRSATGDAFLLGGAAHWQSGGETGGTSDADVLIYTIDGQWEGPGYAITGVLYGSSVDTAGGDRDDFGGMVQGHFFLTDQTGIFARWDGFFLDDSIGLSDDQINFLFVGVNHFLFPESTAVKFTGQLGYAFDDTSPIFGTGSALDGTTNNAFLGDSEEGEFALQFQGQVRF